MHSRFVLIALAVLLPGFTRADAPFLRKLCIDAPTIVLAEPLDPVAPTRFKVLLVIRGKVSPKILAPAGLTVQDVQSFDEIDLETGKPRPRRISQALLFLTADSSPRIMTGGLRLCTEEGRVLGPAPKKTGVKAPELEVRPRLRWPAVVARVRADVAAVDQLQAYRRLGRLERRTQALLGWVERRKGDFASAPVPGMEDQTPAGWEDLQMAVFDWALEGARPEAAWAVVKLFAELNHGESPELRAPVFSMPEGRSLLAKIALNKKVLAADRVRALHLLGEPITLRPPAVAGRTGAQGMTAREQETLLDQLTALLSDKDENFRAVLVRTMARISRPDDHKPPASTNSRVLDALIAAYKTSAPGTGRDELSSAIYSLASPARWTALTGNPPGVFACLRDLELKDGTASFWLLLRADGLIVHEAPVLVLEKYGTLGFMAETRRLPLKVLNLERPWADGWNGADMLGVRQDLPALAPGSSYRIRVEGFVGKGKDRKKWRSEPRRFLIPAIKQPGPRRGGYEEKR